MPETASTKTPLTAGTVVQLKSGGPNMTISQQLDNFWCGCYWFDGYVVRNHNFPGVCLRVVTEDEAADSKLRF